MDVFKVLLAIHIICGGTSLLLGGYILLSKKGGKTHVLFGQIFFYAMLVSALVALPMSFLHPNYFLFIIGVFTSYMLLSGRSYIKKQKANAVTGFDWFLTFAMLLFGLAFITLGIINLVKNNSFGYVMLVFGVASLLFVYQDSINLRGKSRNKNFALTTHIQRMTGSYIASVTAFIVVNNTVLPEILAWLLPSVIFTPLIFIWTKKYQAPLVKSL